MNFIDSPEFIDLGTSELLLKGSKTIGFTDLQAAIHRERKTCFITLKY